MKLDELTRYYPLDPNAVSAARDFASENPIVYDDTVEEEKVEELLFSKFKAAGWTVREGEGYYSTVFSKPGENHVIKVNKRTDRPFQWFAFISRKFPNPHFPKIGNAKILRVPLDFDDFKTTKKYYMYAIEKLQPLPTYHNIDRNIARYCRVIAQEYDKYYTDKEFLANLSTFRDDVLESYPQAENQMDSLKDACLILGKYRKHYAIDIHGKNVMMRGDGTIVISDPYARI